MITFKLLGVVPVFGATESHVRPAGLVAATAVKLRGVTKSVLVSETICCVMDVEPASAVTLMADTLVFSSAVVLTLRVTGITNGGAVDPGTVTVTVPVQDAGA